MEVAIRVDASTDLGARRNRLRVLARRTPNHRCAFLNGLFGLYLKNLLFSMAAL